MDKLSRKDYKAIKGYNNEQMTKYLEGVYKKAWRTGFLAGQESTKKEFRVEYEIDREAPNLSVKYSCPNKECRCELERTTDPALFCCRCGIKLAWPSMGEIEDAQEEEADED